MMTDYNKVEMINDSMQPFFLEFHPPKHSPYQGLWKIKVELPDAYPYNYSSIDFVNKIYHPNDDEMSGSVCLDVIKQTRSSIFVFLPQLRIDPNASDPLDCDDAALMM